MFWMTPSSSTPKSGAEDGARAAGEQRAADDHGGDRVELRAHADHGDARDELGRGERAGEPGQQPAQRVDDDLGPRHRQAHQRGGVLAAADGEQGLAERVRRSTSPPSTNSTRAIQTG